MPSQSPRSRRSARPPIQAPTAAAASLKTDSLAYAITGAAQALSGVRHGTALPEALARVTAQRLQSAQPATPQARGAMQDIAYRTLRWAGTADALVARLTQRPPPTAVHDLLAVALALMLCEDTPYPPFTIVNQAVEAAAANPATAFAKGMVNGVLRSFLREQATLLPEVRRDWVAAYNYPAWWIRLVQQAYPQQWQKLLQVGNTHPAMTLRVNPRQQLAAQYVATLAAQGIAASVVGPQAVRVAKPMPVTQIPGFSEGWVSVQDAGAQLAAPLLAVADGMRVLDACAAPGGKTGHLLELAKVAVTALESDAQRASRIGENLARLAPHTLGRATVQLGDAGAPEAWWDGVPYDRILADVPCSASGIVRRHPDIRWLRRKGDISTLQAEQRRILQALWPLLKPGGRLLYATCSIFPEEGEAQANWFVLHQKDAVRLHAPGQLVPRIQADAQHAGWEADQDGFFYAVFEKQ